MVPGDPIRKWKCVRATYVVTSVLSSRHYGDNLVVLTYHTRSDYCLTDHGQTSDAPLKSSTVTQNLRPHHFVPVFVNVYSLLSFLSLESLNDLHINTVSLQRGYSEDIAIYIDDYKEYEADLLGLLQRVETSSASHLHFRLTEQLAYSNQP